MESRAEQAVEKYLKGYNCAQAVVCTYCDLFGADQELMFKATEGLGRGMAGTFEGTCGAVAGACVLAGLKTSTANLEKPDSKMKTYGLAKEVIRRFEEKNQTISCHVLKGIETKKVLSSCPDCVRDAARLVEEVLLKDEQQ